MSPYVLCAIRFRTEIRRKYENKYSVEIWYEHLLCECMTSADVINGYINIYSVTRSSKSLCFFICRQIYLFIYNARRPHPHKNIIKSIHVTLRQKMQKYATENSLYDFDKNSRHSVWCGVTCVVVMQSIWGHLNAFHEFSAIYSRRKIIINEWILRRPVIDGDIGEINSYLVWNWSLKMTNSRE